MNTPQHEKDVLVRPEIAEPAIKQPRNLLNFFSKGPLSSKESIKNLHDQLSSKPPFQYIDLTTPHNENVADGLKSSESFTSDNNSIEKEVPQLADRFTDTGVESRDMQRMLSLPSPESNDEDVIDVACKLATASDADDTAVVTSDTVDVSDIIVISAVEEPGTEVVESGLKELSRRKRTTQKPSEAAGDGPIKAKRTSSKPANKSDEVELSPTIIKKIDFNRSRIAILVDELVATERLPEHCDTELEIHAAVADVSAALALHGSAPDEFVETSIKLLRTFVARSVQGNAAPLSQLIVSIKERFGSLFASLEAATLFREDQADAAEVVMNMLEKLKDDVVLAEEVKLLATRACFGWKSKSANAFEDAEETAVYRWEVNTPSTYFSEGSQSVMREVKTVRGRYGRLILAIGRVVEALSKNPTDGDERLAELESRVSKSNLELEKAKERKAEADRKKSEERVRKDQKKEEERRKRDEEKQRKDAERAAEKKRKEDEKEEQRMAKQRERDEQLEKKRLNEVDKKDKKVPRQKDPREAAALEKQKNILKSFFKPVAAISAPSAAAATVASEPSPLKISKNFDVDTFDVAVRGHDLPMSELIAYYRGRHRGEGKRGSLRRPVTLCVPVTSSSAQAAFEFVEGFCETRRVTVDSRLKTLRFYEDERPAYFGTFSKRSRVVSGRRPFAKDDQLFNYEYDSEAEWEAEGEDGEDIENSDGGEEEEAREDELEYDEFLLRDNDFGSDADSDGEGVAATLIKSTHKYVVDVAGPLFLTDQVTATRGVDREEDSLRCYRAVDLAPRNLFPTLGASPIPAASVAVAVAVSLESTEAPAPEVKANEPKKVKEYQWTEELLRELVLSVHGSKEGWDKFLAAFQAIHSSVPKTQIRKKVEEIATKARHADGHGSQRWHVKTEILDSLSLVLPPLDFTPKVTTKKRKLPVAAPETSVTPAAKPLAAFLAPVSSAEAVPTQNPLET